MNESDIKEDIKDIIDCKENEKNSHHEYVEPFTKIAFLKCCFWNFEKFTENCIAIAKISDFFTNVQNICHLIGQEEYSIARLTLSVSILYSLCEKCPNTEFFLISILPYSARMQKNTDQKNLRIWTLFTQSESNSNRFPRRENIEISLLVQKELITIN